VKRLTLSTEARAYLYEVFGVTEYKLLRPAGKDALECILENAADAGLTATGDNRLDAEILVWVEEERK